MHRALVLATLGLSACSFLFGPAEPDADDFVINRTNIVAEAGEAVLPAAATGSLDCGLAVPVGPDLGFVEAAVRPAGGLFYVFFRGESSFSFVAVSATSGFEWARTYTVEDMPEDADLRLASDRLQVDLTDRIGEGSADVRVAHVRADGTPTPVQDPNLGVELADQVGAPIGQLGMLDGGFGGLMAIGLDADMPVWTRTYPSLGDVELALRLDEEHLLLLWAAPDGTLRLLRTDVTGQPSCEGEMSLPWTEQDGLETVLDPAGWERMKGILQR